MNPHQIIASTRKLLMQAELDKITEKNPVRIYSHAVSMEAMRETPLENCIGESTQIKITENNEIIAQCTFFTGNKNVHVPLLDHIRLSIAAIADIYHCDAMVNSFTLEYLFAVEGYYCGKQIDENGNACELPEEHKGPCGVPD